jgi:S1-C subfamily serine protease
VAGVRPGGLAVVALVAAVLGSATTLLVAKTAGWVDDDASGSATVLVETAPDDASRAAGGTASPLAGERFDPAAIYARTTPGVVTIYALFQGAARSQGSGFIVSDDGHVLTNSHVITSAGERGPVTGASSVYVVFADGDRLPAEIVGWDLFNDTGVIRVDPEDHAVEPVPLGDSDEVVVGEPVAAIGSPFGNENSLAVGVVSAVSRSIPSLTSRYHVSNAIQVDAPINHGNSGGPLLDARGRVIGINAQIRSESGNAEGVGFAIPINSARRSMEQLVSTGRVTYAYVGISSQDVTPALARKYELGAERGAIIEETVDDSPASRAGLRGSPRQEVFNGSPVAVGGDVIVSVAGRPVERADDVSRIVTELLRPGQRVAFEILRGGKGDPETVQVRLAERPVDP